MKGEGRSFAREQIRASLERLAENAARIERNPGEEEVHDLRVSIRRFSAALRLFRPELNRGEVKRIRRTLRTVMDQAGVVRDGDIGAGLLASAGLAPESALVGELANRTDAARAVLRQTVTRLNQGGFQQRWIARLRL